MTSPPSRPFGSDRERLARVAELRQGGLVAVPELVSELIAPTWAVRRAVVDALANADLTAMPLLCQTLQTSRENEAKIAGLVDALSATRCDIDDLVLQLADDANAAVVCDAAQILGRRESARAVPKLKALTLHENDNVALAAVEALGRIGGREALEPLLELAETRNFFRTFPTIDILGRSRDSRALPTLLKLSADPLYATEALRALGRLGDPAAVPVLLEHLSRASGGLVCTIAVALVAIHDAAEQRFGTGITIERLLLASPSVADARRQLTLGLKRADPSEQLALGQALSWIGEESTIPTLLGLLRAGPAVAQVAAASLKRLGAVAEPLLLDALRAGTSEERRLLVPILGGRQVARDELVACLEDEDSTVRALSCDALAQCSDTSVAPAIFRLLSDPDARVGQAALAAIQSLGSDETRRLALETASSNDARVRRAGLRIIGYFGYPEGLEILIEASQADDEKLREAAIAGLPYIEAPSALGVLLEAAQHESSRTRTAAVRALGHTAGEPHVQGRLREALRDTDAWVRYYACQALGRLQDDSATELMAELLGDDSGQVRVAAVEALAHLRGARAFEVLSEVLSSSDADLYRAALVALGISKKKQALPKLLAALGSSEATTRLVALSALSELGLAEALPAIAAATHDSDEGVRASANGFLAARSDPAATSELLALLSKDPASEAFIHALARPVPGRAHALSDALSGADDVLAGALVASLARMKSEQALSAIRAALDSSNDSARRAAASALVAMQDAPALPRSDAPRFTTPTPKCGEFARLP